MKALRFALPIVGALALSAGLGTATLALADTATSTPLTMGAVQTSVDTDHATVSWTTNNPSDTRVDYGTTTGYGLHVYNSAYVTDHAIDLTGLASGTTYYFKATSSDGTSNVTSVGDSFTTATSSGGTGTSTVATAITNVQAPDVGTSTAMITWNTDQFADSRVNFGTTTSYGMHVSNASDVEDHALTLTGLASSTIYHYRVVSSNDNGTSKSADYSFMTASGSTTLAAPTLLSPANGTTLTSDELQSVNWNAVDDSAGGITYVYQASNASTTNADGSFTNPVYTSSALSTTTLATPGTPEGTYYWHVQATDAGGTMSAWSDTWSLT
ncbi:MAG: fibronectin type III domain-containing protein, partial [Minisyncoccia bacterium]